MGKRYPVEEGKKRELRSLEKHKTKTSAFPCAGLPRCFLSGVSDAIAPCPQIEIIDMSWRARAKRKCIWITDYCYENSLVSRILCGR